MCVSWLKKFSLFSLLSQSHVAFSLSYINPNLTNFPWYMYFNNIFVVFQKKRKQYIVKKTKTLLIYVLYHLHHFSIRVLTWILVYVTPQNPPQTFFPLTSKKKQKYPNHKLDRVLGGKIVSFFKWLWVFLAGPLGNWARNLFKLTWINLQPFVLD